MEISMKDLLSYPGLATHQEWVGIEFLRNFCLDGGHRLSMQMEPSLGGETKWGRSWKICHSRKWSIGTAFVSLELHAWRGVCQDGLQRVQNAGTHTAQFVRETYHREFRKSQDIAREAKTLLRHTLGYVNYIYVIKFYKNLQGYQLFTDPVTYF